MKKSMKPRFIIGVDEVGRGPIAGPVAVGAYIVEVSKLTALKKRIRGVQESKQLTEDEREKWYSIIELIKKEKISHFSVVFQSENVIDRKGIVWAINTALGRALNNCLATLGAEAYECAVLLDGGLKAPSQFINQKTIIKGDVKEPLIALASICAKVQRDRKMRKIALKYKEYGFDMHKGYGTKAHYRAIDTYGLLALHRRSFLKKYMEGLAKKPQIL